MNAMRIIDKFSDYLIIEVMGRNIDRFIKRLYRLDVEIFQMQRIDYRTIRLRIRTSDYPVVVKNKSTYRIRVIQVFGKQRVRKFFYQNRLMLMMIGAGFLVLLFLSNVIFSVQVIHGKREVRELVLGELQDHGVWKYHFRKSFSELERIEEEILKKHKNQLEWIEIENIGTSYQVRVEERMVHPTDKKKENQNVIASKNAIIKSVEAKKGMVVKDINQYVRKGEVVISGVIKKPEEERTKDTVVVPAEGTVYGEVWYTVDVDFPLGFHERKKTGKKKTVYGLKIASKFFSFDFHPFAKKDIQEEIVLHNAMVPVGIVKQKQWEVEQKDRLYTTDEAIMEAEKIAESKISKQLSGKEKIISQKKLKVSEKDSTISLRMFFSVYEDITGYEKIPEEIVEETKTDQSNPS